MSARGAGSVGGGTRGPHRRPSALSNRAYGVTFSTIVAIPWPTPIHMVARP